MVSSPKISAFPMRRGELPVGSGKFLKNGLILVGQVASGDRSPDSSPADLNNCVIKC